jgi:hypothetical protein
MSETWNVGDLVKRIGIAKDRVGIVVGIEASHEHVQVCWGVVTKWIPVRCLKVINASR